MPSEPSFPTTLISVKLIRGHPTKEKREISHVEIGGPQGGSHFHSSISSLSKRRVYISLILC